MANLSTDADRADGFTRLEPKESTWQQVGCGIVGIALFTLFGSIACDASREPELNLTQSWMAFGFGVGCFGLAAAALYGTIHVALSARVPAPVLEIESLELKRGVPVCGRLVQRGPSSFRRLSVWLVCTRTELEQVERETTRSLREDGRSDTETVTLNRGETELAKLELLDLHHVRAAHGEKVVHEFTINLSEDAIPTGQAPASEFFTYVDEWMVITEGEIFGPNSKQEYGVVVV